MNQDARPASGSTTGGPQPHVEHPRTPGSPTSWLQTAHRIGRSLFAALHPCRFALLSVALPAIALLAVPQVQECLRALAERVDDPHLAMVQWIALYAAAIYWATIAWYWTRQLLSIRLPMQSPPDAVFRVAQTYLPRLIGAGALVVLAVALWRAGAGYRHVRSGTLVLNLRYQSVIAAAIAVVFYLIIHYRRRVFRLAAVPQVGRARELPRVTKLVLAITIVVTIMFFLAFSWAPLTVAPPLGAVAILLVAAAAWATAGSIAVFVDGRYGLPVLPVALVALVVFSYWNDNHELRGTRSVARERDTLDSYTASWLEARARELAGPQPYPVLIVASAGGGIRAAYWTGSLLAALQDRYGRRFSDHTFAISGVSGGSLGAATYAALAARDLAGAARHQCQDDPKWTLRACAAAVLSQDFLAPVLGSMLFPDLTQRFLPFTVLRFDRARVLEGSWERAWVDQGLPESMSQPFYDLWSDRQTAVYRPLLLLNSTLVESGERVIVSPVRLPSSDMFAGARELNALTPANLPLSSAAHLSARFTYVSPAASVYDQKHRLVGHLVDGGYFENSGAETAAGLVNTLRSAASRRSPAAILDIHVLLITNEPGVQAAAARKVPDPMRSLTEALAPIAALLNAREARGWEAESAIRPLVAGDGGLLTLGLTSSDVDLPLGWTLSDVAQHEIDRQLAVALDDKRPADAVRVMDRLLCCQAAGSTPGLVTGGGKP